MHRSHSHPTTTPARARWRPALCLGVATALLMALTGAVISAASRTHPVDRPQDVALQPRASVQPADDAAAAALVTRFALNALLATVIDDDTPPRWTDAALHHLCGPATRVEVDGRPMQARTPIPAGAFTLHWHMDQCLPFDTGSLVMSGHVELRVFHDTRGLGATVLTDGLRVTGDTGTARLPAHFAAALSLHGRASSD